MKRTTKTAVTAVVMVAVLVLASLGGGYILAPAARVYRPVPPPVPTAKLVIYQDKLGRISRYLFGANLLWPYNAEGAFDTASDEFYPSFVDEVRELGITALRYPAGTTSDSFDWLRAIGPQSSRQLNEPYGMQGAFKSKICCVLDDPVPSTVGPDEFGRLLDETGSIGTITVNFVTGTPQEAADFVAYMTSPDVRHPSSNPDQASYWAALRAKYGHPRPYDVPYWEVGNEQDGPGQFGWRSGRLVAVGPHRGSCHKGELAVCLYAFGGTTAFADQLVGAFADDEPGASLSTGSPHQVFYVYFPPVVPNSQTVFVNGKAWEAVKDLAAVGRRADVYAFTTTDGRIVFGDGRHGAVPPYGARVTISYESGPHGGFVQFYAAMKKMGPRAQICESEEENLVFLQVMGRSYPYDCVEVHKYARPPDIDAPMTEYEERLMAYPLAEGDQITALQEAIRHYSGRNVPIVLSEYGQLVKPMPAADPDFNLSLDEGLLVASQLSQWIVHNLPVAEKYLLNSAPFLGEYRLSVEMDLAGLSVDSAMIAGPGPPFIVEPTGEAVHLMSQLGGAQRLRCDVVGGPLMEPGPHVEVPILQPLAALHGDMLDIVVINTSPSLPVRTNVDLGALKRGQEVLYTLLDGPSPLAFNTDDHPYEVTTFTRFAVVRGDHSFWWTFPAHSVSLLQLEASRS